MRGPGEAPSETADLTSEECLRLLAAHDFGRLAVGIGEGVPVIRPLHYAFDERSKALILRIGDGSTLRALSHSAKAAFEIDGIDEHAKTGWSVIVTGVAAMLTGAEIASLERSEAVTWATSGQTHWVVIRAGTVSGRRIRSAAERASRAV
jgi:nitroimidazol reductase NimA-like FMN-containing flavoprotein (pyridoxamine 5'-phosphate oxidase superfamily)